GRFDKLCRIYGKRDMPATGVAGGFERLMISLEKKGLFPDLEQNPQVYVAMAGEDVRDETIKVMRALRDSGLRADRDLKERPLKKQMEKCWMAERSAKREGTLDLRSRSKVLKRRRTKREFRTRLIHVSAAAG